MSTSLNRHRQSCFVSNMFVAVSGNILSEYATYFLAHLNTQHLAYWNFVKIALILYLLTSIESINVNGVAQDNKLLTRCFIMLSIFENEREKLGSPYQKVPFLLLHKNLHLLFPLPPGTQHLSLKFHPQEMSVRKFVQCL